MSTLLRLPRSPQPHPLPGRTAALIICVALTAVRANKSMDHVEGVYDAIGTSTDDMAGFLCGGSLYDALDDPEVNKYPMDDTASKKKLLKDLANNMAYSCQDGSMAGFLSHVHGNYDALLRSVTDIIDSTKQFQEDADEVADSTQVCDPTGFYGCSTQGKWAALCVT
jgi:hypothetical protein